MRTLSVEKERWPLKEPLRDGGGALVTLDVIVVTLSQDGRTGRGEAAGVYYLDDDVPAMMEQIDAVRGFVEAGVDREGLLDLLPSGGARNAVDCALWELEARLAGCAVWQLADLPPPKPLLTTYTIGADDPARMAARAAVFSEARALKLKLGGEPGDLDRVRAVRAARPDAWLCVDANQALDRALLERLLPELAAARVELIEQPFPTQRERDLDGLRSPIPFAADESAQDIDDLPGLAGRYDCINIKLDKCGGLTAGLAMARRAHSLGFRVMVGNMTGTVLAMAPAFLVGQLCELVDLDGPLFLEADRGEGAIYRDGRIWCRESAWGGLSNGPG